jgi:putative ABC transport system ATP-binding protein
MPPLIELKNVGMRFKEGSGGPGLERVVLRNLNATLEEGQTVVLLGRSGSGKSTLLNLIGAMDLPTEGEVVVAGAPLHSLSEKERTLFRRRNIGFVFQSFNLIPTLTVEENLLLPQELKGGITEDGRRRALALLDEVGLGDRRKSFPDVLSGGEQQRVAVARARSPDPSLVLADEPTGNLDADTGAQVIALLERLTRHAGKTLVVVTHNPELINMADRTFHMRQGAMEEA